MAKGTILVTGGAGYIGSHTCVEMLQAGYELVVFDNLSNSSEAALERVEEITGKQPIFLHADLLDTAALDTAFRTHDVDAVIHFAGLKAVGESCAKPLRYFTNNITGTLNLLEAMTQHGCRRLVFSSSATVYGDPASVPIREDFPLSATNPYGRTKLIIEDMLRDLCAAHVDWHVVLLRYFNPIGAHASGRIGEDPRDIPNNLVPYIAQVAVGRREKLQVFGDDYPTVDGTGVRDYIHVVDLARGHLAALDKLDDFAGCHAINLGTGRGYSVLEVLKAFSQACGKDVPYEVVARRPGDVAECYADPAQARDLLGWSAELDLERMCADTWRWQSANPEGYSD